MPVVTFDGPTLTISEVAAGIDNTVDAIAIYSEWKAWAALADNAKYPPAFRVIGGDPTSPTQNAGTFFFLNIVAGWSIQPADLDHQLTVVGNLVPEGGVGNVFSAVPGRTVSTRVNFSNLAATLVLPGGSGLDATQAAQLAQVAADTAAIRSDVGEVRLEVRGEFPILIEVLDGETQVVQFEPDGVTERGRWVVRDVSGGPLTLVEGQQAFRGPRQ